MRPDRSDIEATSRPTAQVVERGAWAAGVGRCGWLPPVALGLALLLVTAAGCGSDGSPESDDYGNLLNSPGVCSTTSATVCNDDGDCPPGESCNGLVLVSAEHSTGWRRPDCFACHEIRNMHTVNRTGLPDCGEDVPPPPPGCVDLGEIRGIIDDQGEASCSLCHGMNGVQP